MARYLLSDRAEQDMRQISAYGFLNFTSQQAETYMAGLIMRLQEIADAPLVFPPVENLRKNYRRSVIGSHSIYFVLTDKPGYSVEIIRIIGRQDVYKSLR